MLSCYAGWLAASFDHLNSVGAVDPHPMQNDSKFSSDGYLSPVRFATLMP
jgi:hypothetical protein